MDVKGANAAGTVNPRGPKMEPSDYFQVGKEEPSAERIYLRYPLFKALDEFGLRNTSQDQAGILLGEYSQSQGWVKAEEAFEVKLSDSKPPEELWKDARAAAAKRFPNLKVVGWVHSHPGANIDLQPSAAEVHSKLFPESWQVVYVMNPVKSERGFYSWQNGKIIFNGGFRIYGKEEKNKNMADFEQAPHQEERNRDRYLERSVERLHKIVSHPTVRPVDYVIVALLVLILALQIMRPASSSKSDPALLTNQQNIADSLTLLHTRMGNVEKQLGVESPAAPAEIKGEQPELPTAQTVGNQTNVSAEGASSVDSASTAQENEVGTTGATEATQVDSQGVKIGAKVRLHTVVDGETITSICEKYYKSSSLDLVDAFGRYNKLEAPNYMIVPGDQLKIPERSSLGK